jgi:hypothetical protein
MSIIRQENDQDLAVKRPPGRYQAAFHDEAWLLSCVSSRESGKKFAKYYMGRKNVAPEARYKL